MKLNRCLAVSLFVLSCGGSVMGQTVARIIKKGGNEAKAMFKKDGESKFVRIEPNANKEYILEIDKADLGFYVYADKDSRYHSLYVSEVDEVVIRETENGFVFEGDNAAENQFMKENYYIGYAENEPAQFSEGWMAARRNEVARLIAAAQAAPLSADFKEKQKALIEFTDLYQRLEGPVNARIFRGEDPVLAPTYYAELKDLKFDDPNIVFVGKWWQTMLTAFEQMEREGIIPLSTSGYFTEYAKRIQNADVRSAFLLALLSHTLDKGYSDDFPLFVAQSEQFITKDNEKQKLAALNERYAKLRDLNAAVRRGVPAPDLTMVDLQGKSYKLSDYKGKVVLIDFWFMGCAPCKAEMPYLAQMAKELADKDVVCISLSLDSGDALMEGWRKFIATKGNETLNVNLPGGFTSQECKNYLVRGVPRIVIVDKGGKIVDAYAKRPSDPKLKKQLEELL